jgi:hypothetical protein
MKSHWIYHNSVRIFIADFSGYGSNGAGVKAEAEYVVQLLRSEPDKSVLSLSTVEGTFANEDILRALTELLPISNKKIKRRAVIGVTGFRRHFLDAFAAVVGNVKFSVFDTTEEALDWLSKS